MPESGSDKRLQSSPDSGRPVVKIVRARRQTGKEEETPVRETNSFPLALLIGGVVALAFLGLLVIGGGLAAYLYVSRTPAISPPVASAPPEAALGPDAQAPVAPPNPQPVPANPPLVPPQPPPPKPAIQPVPQGGGSLPVKELKAASVYLKARFATLASSGSGFVIRTQGDTAYVVTNHHVVTPPKEAGSPAFDPFMPFGPRIPGMQAPFGPGFPGMPIGPRIPGMPRRGFPLGMLPGQQAVELTAVFYSGTEREQSVKAVIVAEDGDADLVVLKVVGLKEAPRPIDCERTPEPVETMRVAAFGFPFGEDLDPERKNPAITIMQGHVSSLRLDHGELKEVQLDLDLNPGNSGGPVVDERGALIGVAVAKIVDTRRIGFAVPVHKLNRLLQGHIDMPHVIQTSITQGRTQVRVLARAADPFGKLRSSTLLYGLANELPKPQRGPKGWEKLVGAKSSAMTIRGTQAAATLALTPPAKGKLDILVQVTYQIDTGQTVVGTPGILALHALSTQPNPAKSPVAAARPSGPARGEELTKLLTELKSPDEAARQRAANTLRQAPPNQRRDEVRRRLQELLTAKDAATRTAGAQALAACDPKQAAPALTQLLADEAPAVRHAVLNLLKELKDPRAIEALAVRFPADPILVGEVLKVMGPGAEKAVLPYLAEKYAGVTRFSAIGVIKEIGTAASLPALEAVQGVDRAHVGGVLQSVRERLPLTTDEWPGALDDLKSSEDARRIRATRKIAATPPIEDRRADVVSRLEFLLNDQVGEVRIAAIKGLARWAGKQSISLLAKRLEGFDPGLHAAIMDVLAELKSEEAAAAIAKRMGDVHDQGKAAQALKSMDPRVAEKALLPLLADTNPFKRTEVIKVLEVVGGRDSIALLEKLAGENNIFYSEPAKQALTAIKDRLEANETK